MSLTLDKDSGVRQVVIPGRPVSHEGRPLESVIYSVKLDWGLEDAKGEEAMK